MSVSKETVLQSLGYFKTLQDAANDNKFVAKIEGKGLSTEDFTTAEKNKLEGITPKAQPNTIEIIKVNNIALSPTSDTKIVNVDLTGYALKSDVTSALIYKGTVTNFSDLPTSGNENGHVYNITNAGGTGADGSPIKAGDNVIWNGTGWDNTAGIVDLSAYMTSAQINTTLGNYVTASVAQSTYVAQVAGKGLSANDFTTELKTKLEALIAADDEQITNAEIAALFT